MIDEMLKSALPADNNGAVCPKCEEILKQADEYKIGWQRALADYHNLQKEVARQRSEWATISELQILREFLPVYTNFKTAFAHRPNGDEAAKNWPNWSQGIGLIMKQFFDILAAHQITEIPTLGEPFDPVKHESVGEEMTDRQPDHTVIKEVETGYMMNGKVV